jgi:tetratricopeptide (TPR) repeat protein
VLAQNDEYFPALNKMAMAYLELGDYKKATDELTRMINMDKAESVTYYNLAVCYVRLQDPDAALNTLSHAADLYGRDFVLSWVKSNDFDSVRELEKFQAFIAALTEAPSPE